MAIRGLRKQLIRQWTKKINEFVRLWHERSFRPGTIVAKRYRIVDKLGSGSYGVAYLCRDIRRDRPCVMKRIAPLRGGKSRAELIYARETQMLGRLHHQAIPALYDTLLHKNHPCFIMEYMTGSSLDYMLFHENRKFTEKQSLLIVKKVLDVVEYMHSSGIIHRDISISNVLLDGDEIRLIDLGLSRPFGDAEQKGKDQDDAEDDDPTEKKLRREIHVTSDFYAVGHLLLFLLYSDYSAKPSARADEEASWEQELSLHPDTTKLLRRLLMTEQPFDNVRTVQQEVDRIISRMETVS